MRLTCLVDNCVQAGSSLWGEHGLAFLIETEGGNVLWDTGQSGTVLWHNWEALGLQDVPLAAIALSHAHYDHTGGLLSVLERRPGLALYGHSALLTPRYSRRGAELRAIGLAWPREELERRASLQLAEAPQEIVPGVWTSGSIQPRPHPQGASAHHLQGRSGELVPDRYEDDLSLVLQTNEGWMLLCGCCHAGLRNTLAAVRALGHGPLRAIVGGTHLTSADAAELAAIVALLRAEGPPDIYLNHCTGEKAFLALYQALGQRVHSCPAGTQLAF